MADHSLILLDRVGPGRWLSTETLHLGEADAAIIEAIPQGGSPATDLTIFDSNDPATGFTATVDSAGTAPGLTGYTKFLVASVLPYLKASISVDSGIWTIRATPVRSARNPIVLPRKAVAFAADSPDAAGFETLTTWTGLGGYRHAQIYARLQGATGGTLDLYLQVSPDFGTTWIDYAHWPQLAAGAAAVEYVTTVAKADARDSFAAVGSGSGPALAANTVIGGDWGDRMRLVAVAGAGTTAGAQQIVRILLTE